MKRGMCPKRDISVNKGKKNVSLKAANFSLSAMVPNVVSRVIVERTMELWLLRLSDITDILV